MFFFDFFINLFEVGVDLFVNLSIESYFFVLEIMNIVVCDGVV